MPRKSRQPKKSILRKDTTAGETSSSSRSRSREVCWGDLEVYEFASILGDNPSAVEGSPLTLSWKLQEKHVVGIDYQEFMRKEKRRKRRDLYIPGAQRDTYLLSLGYSLKQLLKLAEENDSIRRSRQQNMKGRFDSFKKVFTMATKTSKANKGGSSMVPVPNIVASRSG
mmetsp:Transcript_24494/g.57454  ORF Transcript_24494/g.57454 Transcript_24494/m.57454 type:complete len:169 (+) Transcript_24494:315-821(+)